MGYGAGGFLLVVGLVLAFAIDRDQVDGVDLHTIGLIASGVGILLIVLTAITLNSRRAARTTTTTTHSDGSQSVRDTRTDV
ncbi:DUF6458 family protein [Nocardioides sp. TRM66260-LWL]|uniref:DUF6458 family protein n=1 Tax=Nocardioides sp. TRM66260-LWL TaxID=2874478 RepID=UPI001CC45E2E|nr:DUF6458 family protein [Nocardioides sp. TRM66260-LWL]MBZ5733448.1 DUF6458 family protein [Nocardioides sp. TRM66260-LWL]